MRLSSRVNAQYIVPGASSSTARIEKLKSRSRWGVAKIAKTVLIASLALGVVGSTLSLASLAVPASAAEEDDTKAQDTMKKAAEEAGITGDPKGYEKLSSNGNNDRSGDSFLQIFGRMFTTGYLNETPRAYAPAGMSNPGVNCNPKDPRNGTVIYHNCDVPNIVTEFAQDVTKMVAPTGARDAEKTSSELMNKWFGLPTSLIPNDNVPLDRSSGTPKFTGLEIFGYNLKYSMYKGEWDHIKVMTSARTMSNFGLMDNILIGSSTVFNSVANALSTGANKFSTELAQGNLLQAVGGFFAGAVEGAATGALGTILDTSDLNVFNMNAWYRPGFGATTYGARELSSNEMAAEATAAMTKMISDSSNKLGVPGLPADFPPQSAPSPGPSEAISACSVVVSEDGKKVSYGDTTSAPGVSKADCVARAEANAAAMDKKPSGELYTWSANGTAKEETWAAWGKRNSGAFDAASKYGMSCKVPSNGSNRSSAMAELNSCWASEYRKAHTSEMDKQSVKENTDWRKLLLSPAYMSGWMADNSDAAFNAPWNRYICVDSKGRDMVDTKTGRFMRVYKSNGALTGNCGAIRPPIQGGLFGDGYKGQSAYDTRQIPVGGSFIDVVFDSGEFVNTFANVSLGVSVFATRLSNSAINLAFSPVLDTLGIQDRVVSLIKSFRDGIFFPLVTLVVAIGAIGLFARQLRGGQAAGAVTSFVYMALAFIISVAVLVNPAKTIKVVDEFPAAVEATVLGAIFDAGSNSRDQLCTATNTVKSPKSKDMNGSILKTAPKDATRTLMCENWRTFAFTPWVYGQWGTGYENLYAKGFAPAGGSALSNSNTALVGNAGVNFGGGKTVNNWSTYQLAVQSSGTATTADASATNGKTDPNWYRIVDAQAGPNNGAGTDGSHFMQWSGKDPSSRITAAFVSPITSITGAVVVIVYMIQKIIVTITVTMLLLILPIMLLLGIHPTFGRAQLKKYGFTIVGLVGQRIVLTILIALMLKIVLSIASSTTSFLVTMAVTMAALIAFMIYRKEILGLVTKTTDAAAGAFMGGIAYDPKSTVDGLTPGSLQNAAYNVKAGSQGFVEGTVAGALTGKSMKDALAMGKQSADIRTRRETNRQLIQGLPGVQNASRVIDSVDRQNRQRMNDDRFAAGKEDVADRVRELSAQRQRNNYQGYDASVGKGGIISATDLDGERHNLPGSAEGMRTVGSEAGDRRGMNRIADLDRKLDAIRDDVAKVAAAEAREWANAGNRNDTDRRAFRDELIADKLEENPEYQALYSARRSEVDSLAKKLSKEQTLEEARLDMKQKAREIFNGPK